MAHIQLVSDPWLLQNKPWLFHKGTRLFVKGDSGVEKLHIGVDRTITLELAGTNPTPVGVVSSDPKNFTLTPVNGQRQFTIKATAAGTTILTGTDAAGKA